MLFLKNKQKINIVCDLGLRSVGVALFRESPKPEIIYSKRIYLPREEVKNHSENLEFSTNLAFEDLTKNGLKLLRERGGSFTIEKMYCVLNSPWYIAETRKIMVQREEEFTISQKIIDEEIEKEEKKFKEKITEHFSKKIFHGGVQLLERTITSFSINGYETDSPLQKKATSLTLTSYMSAMPHEIFETIRKKAHKNFHIDQVIFTAFPLVLLRATRVLFKKEHDFVALHLGAESTDISAITRGSVEETGVVPVGYGKIVDLIQDKFGVTSDIAFSFISIFSSNMAETSMQNTIMLLVSQEIESWKKEVSSLQEKWPNLSKRKLFLLSEKEIEPAFKLPAKEALSKIISDVFFVTQLDMKDKVVIGAKANFDHSLFVSVVGLLNFSNLN